MVGQQAPEFVEIPAGTFVMGDDAGADDERPAHPVSLASFHLAVHPVTNLEYASFVQATGHRLPAIHELPVIVTAGGRDREGAFRQLAAPYAWSGGVPPPELADHPVTLVRFEDALAYCAWLTSQTGKRIRLPSEAEWERAARGGVDSRRFPWGDEIDATRSNYLSDPSLKALHGSRAVRSFPPNDYGLFDMAGNVWQWVSDWYDPEYYRQSPQVNPTGPGSGRFRVVRGGAWLTADVRMLTCAHRHKVPPDTYSYSIGFRVAY
jgi:sulfatase modifying factor 1